MDLQVFLETVADSSAFSLVYQGRTERSALSRRLPAWLLVPPELAFLFFLRIMLFGFPASLCSVIPVFLLYSCLSLLRLLFFEGMRLAGKDRFKLNRIFQIGIGGLRIADLQERSRA